MEKSNIKLKPKQTLEIKPKIHMDNCWDTLTIERDGSNIIFHAGVDNVGSSFCVDYSEFMKLLGKLGD
jgi:hypothetical protein